MRSCFRSVPALLALGLAWMGCTPSDEPVAPADSGTNAPAATRPVVLAVNDMV
jgi:hypothetical protein